MPDELLRRRISTAMKAVAAAAEARALQARMNPHFLFNALNALAALSTVAPREVPRATGRLRQFLRVSFDQQERVLVTLEEELAVVREVEHLFFAERPRVHALVLLRRRLQGSFGRSFQLEVRSWGCNILG
jgi:LytS/YehU family sensor histidine kinase